MEKEKITELVVQAQRGDPEAMNELISQCYQRLYAAAYQTVKDPDVACDVTQEACLEIVSTLSKLENPAAFYVWAQKITYHQCTRHFRRNKELLVDENEDGETIFDSLPDESEGAQIDEAYENKEFRREMMAIIDSLPPEQRSALLLHYYERLSVKQIAEIQETTEGTVKSRLNYGRKAVKKQVEAYEKRNDIKLHSVAPLGLLLWWLYGREKDAAAGITLDAMPKVVQALAVLAGKGAVASGAVGAAAAGIALPKVIAGCVAAVLAVGAIGGGVALLNQPEEEVGGRPSYHAPVKKPAPTTSSSSLPTSIPTSVPTGSQEEDDMDKILGRWVVADEWGEDDCNTMDILPDGTLTVTGGILDAGVDYEWALRSVEANKVKLEVKRAKHYYGPNEMRPTAAYITFTRTKENTFAANVKVSSLGSGEDYYRAGDYQMVELTAENVMQYLELEQSFRYATNDLGFTERIDNYVEVRFKEGVGQPSYCKANFRFHMITKEVTFEDKPDGYTLGATVKEEDGEPFIIQYGKPELTAKYAYQFYFAERWSYVDDNLGGQTHTCEMTFYELIGAENVVGYVFIPVKK